jgi:DNA mismatch repair ATPase MutS
VFDELYSGTNPEEAVSSATAFMDYIVKNKNMSCLLTTHFVKVCKNLKKNENVVNCHMETENIDNRLHYKYKLKQGISLLKGGISVLKEMNYPKELLINLFHL